MSAGTVWEPRTVCPDAVASPSRWWREVTAAFAWAVVLFVGGLPTREAFEVGAVGYSGFTL